MIIFQLRRNHPNSTKLNYLSYCSLHYDSQNGTHFHIALHPLWIHQIHSPDQKDRWFLGCHITVHASQPLHLWSPKVGRNNNRTVVLCFSFCDRLSQTSKLQRSFYLSFLHCWDYRWHSILQNHRILYSYCGAKEALLSY